MEVAREVFMTNKRRRYKQIFTLDERLRQMAHAAHVRPPVEADHQDTDEEGDDLGALPVPQGVPQRVGIVVVAAASARRSTPR